MICSHPGRAGSQPERYHSQRSIPLRQQHADERWHGGIRGRLSDGQQNTDLREKVVAYPHHCPSVEAMDLHCRRLGLLIDRDVWTLTRKVTLSRRSESNPHVGKKAVDSSRSDLDLSFRVRRSSFPHRPRSTSPHFRRKHHLQCRQDFIESIAPIKLHGV